MWNLHLVGKPAAGRSTSLDDEDNDLRITVYNWCVVRNQDGYEFICRSWCDKNGVSHRERLCHVVLERKLGRLIRSGWDCHHLDGDSIGNTHRANLMELPRALHCMLRHDRDFNFSSQYRWVSKHGNAWRVFMRLPNGKRHSKLFKDELEAARYADELFIQYYGHWFRDYPELDIKMWLNFSRTDYPADL